MKAAKTKAGPPLGRGGKRGKPKELNQATADDFEREGLGIAPKE
jgi:hypothetical protein